MGRDRTGIAALLAAVPFLYIGWYLSWYGTFATTCTGSDPKSLGAGMFLSLLPYAVAILALHLSNLSRAGMLFSIPLVLLFAKQALWGVELFIVVNVDGRSACNLMMEEDFGEASGGLLEQVYSIYYFGGSMLCLWAIGCSHWRYCVEKNL